MAVAGIRGQQMFLHSHMTAVLPEHQNRGIGRQLKLAQRDDALARGIAMVEWTFDPLEIRNAYFNVVRLGAVMSRFIPDCYGVTDSPLHGGLPTGSAGGRMVGEFGSGEGDPRGAAAEAGPERRGERTRAADGHRRDHRRWPAAEEIQTRIRRDSVKLFAAGFTVTGFETGDREANYVLEKGFEVR